MLRSGTAKLQSLEVTPMTPWRAFLTHSSLADTQHQDDAAGLQQIATIAVLELPCDQHTRQYVVRVSSKKQLAVVGRPREATERLTTHCVTKELADFEALRSALYRAVLESRDGAYCAFCRTVSTVYPAKEHSSGSWFGGADKPELMRRSLEQFISDLVAMHHAAVGQNQHQCHGKRQAWELLTRFLLPSSVETV